MSNWKREMKKEEKRKEIKYTKRVRKEAIEKSLQREIKRSRKKSKVGGPLKSAESELKNLGKTVEEKVFKRNRKKKLS
ncbi:MAG: hypothetical protein M0Z77_07075 [Thermoplasmatales archaeon]|nr:hypothetical protein [Candidatus Thermoplasmatota archaeon]MCL6003313.1 hypothetical protein [Candidatus Thermoplasmatota archaeon]MDA8055395.1 hypothetical protein [Thermoplasmatales archaeon]